MGLSLASCSVWSRDLESDKFLDQPDWIRYRRNDIDPITFQELAMSHFHHSIYLYSLVQYPYNMKNTKAIYLYADSGIHDKLGTRLMKCEFRGSSINIFFRNQEVLKIWNNTDEKTDWFDYSKEKLWKKFTERWEFAKVEDPGYISFGRIVWRRKYNYNKNAITPNRYLTNTYHYDEDDTV